MAVPLTGLVDAIRAFRQQTEARGGTTLEAYRPALDRLDELTEIR